MLSGAQIRAGRALMGWSLEDFGAMVGVHPTTIHRIEKSDGIPDCRFDTMRSIEQVFEMTGQIAFDSLDAIFFLPNSIAEVQYD